MNELPARPDTFERDTVASVSAYITLGGALILLSIIVQAFDTGSEGDG